jgi:YjbE family integral membrane protein
MLDLALSGDNIGIIALATKNLPEKHAKRASVFGVIAAVVLRILFACFVTVIISIQWLPIKLVGGLLLVKITWDFIKPHEEEEENANVKVANRFWEAVWVIIIADLSMSLDNVLAIAGAANGNIGLIVFGIFLNIPILFFGSRFVANLMNKYAIVIYMAGAILAHTALGMIFEDHLIEPHVPHMVALIVPWLAAVAIITYGFYISKKVPAQSELAAEEQ